ncbi:hypothetical protein CEXT_478211 [Caerostris extrusa]|uniref:Uncharacterized protein n=1 Tax=Caerostris extrusa TaxID=172846 RepID=A0AAV4XPD8_CAEEX|nr:hypothetical protein CEXT_478211 [Caerostris extrusa]
MEIKQRRRAHISKPQVAAHLHTSGVHVVAVEIEGGEVAHHVEREDDLDQPASRLDAVGEAAVPPPHPLVSWKKKGRLQNS